MKVLLAAVMVSSLARSAAAGPYCGIDRGFAPASDTKLPVAPTIAHFVEDAYYRGKRLRKAKPATVRVTLDGKPVTLKTKDVRTVDGVIRFITIASRKTGKLEVSQRDPYENETNVVASYEIVKDWSAAETPTAVIAHASDRRLGPYRYIGDAAAVRVDVPAIAFTLRWRRNAEQPWVVRQLPADINDDQSYDPDAKDLAARWKRAPHWGQSEAWVGERMCGMVENVPLALVEAGIEAELTAKLPNGRSIALAVPSPLVLPRPPKQPQPE